MTIRSPPDQPPHHTTSAPHHTPPHRHHTDERQELDSEAHPKPRRRLTLMPNTPHHVAACKANTAACKRSIHTTTDRHGQKQEHTTHTIRSHAPSPVSSVVTLHHYHDQHKTRTHRTPVRPEEHPHHIHTRTRMHDMGGAQTLSKPNRGGRCTEEEEEGTTRRPSLGRALSPAAGWERRRRGGGGRAARSEARLRLLRGSRREEGGARRRGGGRR